MTEFQTHDYAIGGKMVVGRTTLTEEYHQMVQDGDDEARKRLKSELVHQMADFMLEKNLVEFTYQKNPLDYSLTIAIRAYLAPNDQVRILRSVIKV